jgi:hypothetical protein
MAIFRPGFSTSTPGCYRLYIQPPVLKPFFLAIQSRTRPANCSLEAESGTWAVRKEGRRGASGAEALLGTSGNTVNRVLPEGAGVSRQDAKAQRAQGVSLRLCGFA